MDLNDDRDNFRRFREIQPGQQNEARAVDPNQRREAHVEFREEDEYFEDAVLDEAEEAEARAADQRLRERVAHMQHQPRLNAMARILEEIENEPEQVNLVVDPPPAPDNQADRDYLDNLNRRFEQLNVANLIPPPPPVVQRPVYRLPTTGVDTTKHLVRHQIQVSELLAQQQQTLNNLLFWVGNPNLQNDTLGAVRNAVAQSAQTALELKAQAVHFQANLQRAEHVTDRYSSTPTMPNWNNICRDAPMGRPCDIIAACGKFDPAQPEADFAIIWDNLRFYGTNHRWRENNYRMALSFLLEGEAKRIFHDHMDINPVPALEVIVDTIYKAYAKPRSTIDDKQALKDVVRQANEPLPRCIARGTIAIDRQRYMHDQREWPVLRKNLIRELVYQVVEKPTQKFINWLENDSIATTGVVCDVDRLIEMVDQEEKRHGWMPKYVKPVVFQAASTGIFHNPKIDKNHPPRKGGPSHKHPKPPHQPQPPPQTTNQPTPPKAKHQVHGTGKKPQVISTNATDFDGDDTMTGREPSRSRSYKRGPKGKPRTHSAEADRTRSESRGRDYAKKKHRSSSHSPDPRKKPKVKFNKDQPWYEKDKSTEKKKKKKSSSQTQSGSKNVIVRVDQAGLKGTFCLNANNMISDPNVKADYVIKDSGSEN